MDAGNADEIAELLRPEHRRAGRQHADDHDRLVVELDGCPANRGRIAAEATRPERMADYSPRHSPRNGPRQAGNRGRATGVMPKSAKKLALTAAPRAVPPRRCPSALSSRRSSPPGLRTSRSAPARRRCGPRSRGPTGSAPGNRARQSAAPPTGRRRETGRGVRRTALMTLNSAVFAPIPRERIATATAVSGRSRHSRRRACRTARAGMSA